MGQGRTGSSFLPYWLFPEYEQRTLHGALIVTLAMLLRIIHCRFIIYYYYISEEMMTTMMAFCRRQRTWVWRRRSATYARVSVGLSFGFAVRIPALHTPWRLLRWPLSGSGSPKYHVSCGDRRSTVVNGGAQKRLFTAPTCRITPYCPVFHLMLCLLFCWLIIYWPSIVNSHVTAPYKLSFHYYYYYYYFMSTGAAFCRN